MSGMDNSEAALLIESVEAYAQRYMSQPQFDASHDYNHIRRVVGLANHILRVEQGSHPPNYYDPTTLTLSALLHDVGDRKYAAEPSGSVASPDAEVESILRKLGAPASLASKVQTIVKNVSFSNEVRNPAAVREMVLQYPELAIVQDADRLDGKSLIFASIRS